MDSAQPGRSDAKLRINRLTGALCALAFAAVAVASLVGKDGGPLGLVLGAVALVGLAVSLVLVCRGHFGRELRQQASPTSPADLSSTAPPR